MKNIGTMKIAATAISTRVVDERLQDPVGAGGLAGSPGRGIVAPALAVTGSRSGCVALT